MHDSKKCERAHSLKNVKKVEGEKMKKRLFAGFVATAMMATMLTGCGGDDADHVAA